MKKNTLAVITALLSLTFVVTGCSESTGNTPITSTTVPVYRIWVIAPLTGDAAVYGEEEKRVLDYRVEQMNKDAIKNGYKVELVYEDGKCDGAAASAAFQKLTDIDGTKMILGGFCSSESLAMAPLLDTKKDVLLISAASSSPVIEGKHPRLFSLSYNDNTIGEWIVSELKKYKKVAIISEQNDYNQGVHDVVVNELKKNAPETLVIIDEWFSKGSTDFRNELEKLKKSGADAVFLNPNAGVTAEAMLRQIAEIKDWKTQFVSHIAYMSPDVIKIAPQAVEGTIVFDAPTVNSPEFIKYQNEIIAEKGSLKNLGTYYTASFIDTLDMIINLTKQYGENTEQIRNAISTGTFHGWLGDIHFDGHSFIQWIPSARFIVHNGKVESTLTQ